MVCYFEPDETIPGDTSEPLKLDAMVAALLLLPLLGVIAGVIAWIGNWMLKPLEDAARRRRGPVRISIVDLFCLFVNVQLPLGVLAWFMSAADVELPAGFLIFCAVLGLIIWISSAVRLSRAGVASGKDRFLFLGVVVPVAFYGIPTFVVLAPIAFVSLFSQASDRVERFVLLIPSALVAAALVACGLFTRRMVRRIAVDSSPADIGNESSGGS